MNTSSVNYAYSHMMDDVSMVFSAKESYGSEERVAASPGRQAVMVFPLPVSIPKKLPSSWKLSTAEAKLVRKSTIHWYLVLKANIMSL